MSKTPILFPIATPIGNYKDITIRAIEVLKSVDVIIAEEISTAERLLKKYDIIGKRIIALNEHNEKTDTKEIFENLVENNLSAALISEAGTPCLADPGASLVNLFHKNKLKISPIPGISSITATLMVSGLLTDKFKYIGFLSPKKEDRQKELKLLTNEKLPVIILETPYRRKAFLKDIHDILGPKKNMVFAYKLTQPEEFILKASISEIIKQTESLKKGEFVVVLLF